MITAFFLSLPQNVEAVLCVNPDQLTLPAGTGSGYVFVVEPASPSGGFATWVSNYAGCTLYGLANFSGTVQYFETRQTVYYGAWETSGYGGIICIAWRHDTLNTNDCDDDGIPDLEDYDIIGEPDEDADGIPDAIDPYPSDYVPFDFQITMFQKDEMGAYTWYLIETSRGDQVEYGVFDPDKLTILNVAAETYSSDTLVTNEIGQSGLIITEGGNTDVYFNHDAEIPLTPDGSVTQDDTLSTETGTNNNVTNVTPEDFLSDIVENSAAAVENEAIQADYLKTMTDYLQTIAVSTAIDPETEGAVDGSSDVAQALQDQTDAIALEAQTEADRVISDVSVPSYDSDLPATDYLTEQSDLEATMDTAKAQMSEIESKLGYSVVSSNPVLSCNVFGMEIVFDFGKYHDIWVMIGTFMMSLAYLFSFVIIMRG